MKQKVLLSAYACEPNKGSEPAVGWNWANELERMGYEVYVLTRSNNAANIQREVAKTGSQISYLFYDLPRPLLALKKYMGIYLYYTLWQYGAYMYVRKKFSKDFFHIVHHLTFVSFRFPTFMFRFNGKFILGPVGGGEEAEGDLVKALPGKYRMKEYMRRKLNRLNRYNVLINKAYKNADAIYTTTLETAEKIPQRFQNKVAVSPAIGVDSKGFSTAAKKEEAFTILYAGNLLHWKGVHLAIEAFARLKAVHKRIRLKIVGSGDYKYYLQELARNLNVDNDITFINRLPQQELFTVYESSHVFLFPSLHDSGGFVVLEALAHGIPVVCLDKGGPAYFVGTDSGNVIKTAGRSTKEITNCIAQRLQTLIEQKDILAEEEMRARERAKKFNWTDTVQNVYAGLNR